jgi:hypothetical protein
MKQVMLGLPVGEGRKKDTHIQSHRSHPLQFAHGMAL